MALMGFAGGYLLSVIAVTVTESITGDKATGQSTPLPILVSGVAGLWVGLLAAVAVWSFTSGSGSLVRDFGLRVGAWWDVPLGVACGLAGQYGLVPLLYLPFEQLDHSLSHHLGQPTQRETSAASHGSAAAVVAVVLVLAVGAPLVEELFFRGLLLRALLARTAVPVAVGADAVLFGLAHAEPLQLAGLAAFGVVLAVLAWKTGRLAAPISAHMAFNVSAVLSAVHLH